MDGMPDSHIKEHISRAYAMAIAAQTGIICDIRNTDYGTDGDFKRVNRYPSGDGDHEDFFETGEMIHFQLKATVKYQIRDHLIIYDLRARNYRDLIDQKGAYPKILILYILPREKSEWVTVDDHTTLSKCAWWCSLKGLPQNTSDSTVRIEIPLEQKLTPQELHRLMQAVVNGGEL